MHYVIGDVHGCYDEMMELINEIEKKDENARIIFVGDFIDRGPKVDKVLDWCMKNITEDGKYQAVRGNHEQMAIDWYREWLEWYQETNGKNFADMPKSEFDFSKWMDRMDWVYPDKLEPVISFFRTLPLSKKVEITSDKGNEIVYRIVHAYYKYGKVTEEEQRYANLWLRVNGGNEGSDEIIIHGHTPTFDFVYLNMDWHNTKPGMISYRKNEINIDGGCVFGGYFPYPCMLCAICLETLEEIYSRTLEERFMQLARYPMDEEEAEVEADSYRDEFMKEESNWRKEMLCRL